MMDDMKTHACDSNLIDIEYYQLTLSHRDRYGSCIELPITAKAMVNPSFRQMLSCDGYEALIDDLCRELKECWMSTRRNG